jgi:hypothetical protein
MSRERPVKPPGIREPARTKVLRLKAKSTDPSKIRVSRFAVYGRVSFRIKCRLSRQRRHRGAQ